MAAIERRTTVLRACLALVAGMVVAVLLVIAQVAPDAIASDNAARVRGVRPIFSASVEIFIAFWGAAEFALVIGALSVPVWLGLQRLRLDGWRSAAATGFIMTLVVWVADGLFEGQGSVGEALASVDSGLQWAATGAVAGLATWRLAYRKAPASPLLVAAEFD